MKWRWLKYLDVFKIKKVLTVTLLMLLAGIMLCIGTKMTRKIANNIPQEDENDEEEQMGFEKKTIFG